MQDLRRQLETVSAKRDTARYRLADVLHRLEHLIREKERPPSELEGGSGCPTPPEGRP